MHGQQYKSHVMNITCALQLSLGKSQSVHLVATVDIFHLEVEIQGDQPNELLYATIKHSM